MILYKAMQLNNDFEVKKIIGRDEKPKTHMVFTNQEKRRHFIKQLIESPFFDEIESSDTIFVSNNKNGFQEKKQIITKEEIMGIVDKIDEPNVTTEFYIDKKTPKKNFLTVNIQYLINEINALLEDLLDCRNVEFEIEFVKKLNEIFGKMEEGKEWQES